MLNESLVHEMSSLSGEEDGEWEGVNNVGRRITSADIRELCLLEDPEKADRVRNRLHEVQDRTLGPVDAKVVRTILALWPQCTPVGRARALDVLAHLAGCDLESSGVEGVREQCLHELGGAFSLFAHWLSYGPEAEMGDCVDLVTALAMARPEFRAKAIEALQKAKLRAGESGVSELIENCLKELN